MNIYVCHCNKNDSSLYFINRFRFIVPLAHMILPTTTAKGE